MSWLDWWPWNRTERESHLLQEVARLRLELELEHLRSEELRRWIMANVAVAAKVSGMLGAVDESPVPRFSLLTTDGRGW